MDDTVVVLAEQGGVVQVGPPAVEPVQDMVGPRPGTGSIAAGIGAVLVPPEQLAALGLVEETDLLALVELLAIGTEHVRDQVGRTGHQAQHRG